MQRRLVSRQNNNNNNPGVDTFKLKVLIMELKKLALLCQRKLHLKLNTSLYSEIQQYQVH